MNNFFGPKTIVGEMYIIDTDGYTVDITQTGTFLPLTGFHKGLEKYLDVDEVAGTFTIKIKGSYKFDGVASVFPSAGMLLDFAVFLERPPAVAIKIDKIKTCLDFKNSQATNTFSGTGWLDLEVGDIITIRGQSDTQPVTVTICSMNINIFRKGL